MNIIHSGSTRQHLSRTAQGGCSPQYAADLRQQISVAEYLCFSEDQFAVLESETLHVGRCLGGEKCSVLATNFCHADYFVQVQNLFQS